MGYELTTFHIGDLRAERAHRSEARTCSSSRSNCSSGCNSETRMSVFETSRFAAASVLARAEAGAFGIVSQYAAVRHGIFSGSRVIISRFSRTVGLALRRNW